MATSAERTARHLAAFHGPDGSDSLSARLAPDHGESPPRVPFGAVPSGTEVEARWGALPLSASSRAVLAGPGVLEAVAAFAGHIENCIGAVAVPVGLAGPLRVNGSAAHGDYYIPLATTEAALVASYSRGAQVISEAGGCAALLLDEGVGRSPGFAFRDLAECGRFVAWALTQLDAFSEVAARTTRHGSLKDMRAAVEGNHVYLHLDYETGDAAGQNMVTIASEAICAYIAEHSPVQPRYFFVEANLSGDKKASAQSFLTVRGKKVTAEVTISADLVARRLHTTPARMAEYFQMGALGGVLSGTLGVQGHFANGLAALYIACGQDAACVAESAVGVTRFELTPEGDLYGAVTLPNIIVGTVGGGTALPSQRACLDILGLAGPGHGRALAEVCAGLCLAGELSLTAALCAGEFTQAHQSLARGVPAVATPSAAGAPSAGAPSAATARPAHG
jgi:hydroxymethylglutaryl-CoA reductase (NADPH)